MGLVNIFNFEYESIQLHPYSIKYLFFYHLGALQSAIWQVTKQKREYSILYSVHGTNISTMILCVQEILFMFINGSCCSHILYTGILILIRSSTISLEPILYCRWWTLWRRLYCWTISFPSRITSWLYGQRPGICTFLVVLLLLNSVFGEYKCWTSTYNCTENYKLIVRAKTR